MSERKSNRGRPKKDEIHLRSESLLVRLELTEKVGFQEAAKVAGLSLAAWVRERLRKSAARELESEGRQVPFYENIVEG